MDHGLNCIDDRQDKCLLEVGCLNIVSFRTSFERLCVATSAFELHESTHKKRVSASLQTGWCYTLLVILRTMSPQGGLV